MKYFYFLFILMFISCSTSKKTYVCGDRPCIDKKESKEYFTKNLSVEIQKNKSKKNSSISLIELNTKGFDTNNKTSKDIIDNKKLIKKQQKTIIKEQKTRLRYERKRKKTDEMNRAKEEKKLAKLNKKNKNNVIFDIGNVENKNEVLVKPIKVLNENRSQTRKKNSKEMQIFESVKSKKQQSICEKIEGCDIDKIAELLIKKGSEKSFPDITSK